MSQIFLPNGRVVPVTVVQLKSPEKIEQGDIFMDKDVEITGRSKGKGFTGAIKRWGFRKQGETRGASNKVRAPGAIGAQTPGRVFKGKKMAGHKGDIKVTVKGLKIVNVDTETNKIMVSGSVPGARNSNVVMKVKDVEDVKQQKKVEVEVKEEK